MRTDMRLSPKAIVFIREEMSAPEAGWIRDAVGVLGRDPWSDDLTPAAAKTAFQILASTEKRMINELDRPNLDPAREAELLNDLGFVEEVEADLQSAMG
jgi:hypothetical protein